MLSHGFDDVVVVVLLFIGMMKVLVSRLRLRPGHFTTSLLRERTNLASVLEMSWWVGGWGKKLIKCIYQSRWHLNF